jgi:magnesium chelatase family protein
MLSRIRTVAFSGVDVLDIDVQVQITQGLPAFTIVGLPDKAVAESRERVRAALHSMGLGLPPKRIIVNLAPADLAKEGSHFDLPIALGLLMAMAVVPVDALAGFLALGELALDGAITPVSGILPAALAASQQGLGLICPVQGAAEARWAGDIDIWASPSLLALVNHVKGTAVLPPPERAVMPPTVGPVLDFRDVRGQETAKRAMEIAAAGGHNLLLIGPPGSGKSMMAARLPGILPPLSAREALDVSLIHSVAGMLDGYGLVQTRPYRDPHHSASLPALVGGGAKAKPGEISLAHNGVLFLDELPEFQRPALEALRQPMETGRVTVARANHHVTYPARFQLVAAMNPCRCGYLDDPGRACSKAPRCGTDYQAKLSGPILDRIDLVLSVPPVMAADLARPPTGDDSATIRQRVIAARNRQLIKGGDGARCNAELSGDALDTATLLDSETHLLLQKAADRLKLSARGYHRVLRVARTLADLNDRYAIIRADIAEALSYRI